MHIHKYGMIIQKCLTAWKESLFGVFLIRIFPHSVGWKYVEILRKIVRMRENADQKNSEYGHFSRVLYKTLSNIYHMTFCENKWRMNNDHYFHKTFYLDV